MDDWTENKLREHRMKIKPEDDTTKTRTEKNRKASEDKAPADKNADGDAASDKGNGAPDFYAMDGVDRNLSTGGVTLSGTYETARTTSMP